MNVLGRWSSIELLLSSTLQVGLLVDEGVEWLGGHTPLGLVEEDSLQLFKKNDKISNYSFDFQKAIILGIHKET